MARKRKTKFEDHYNLPLPRAKRTYRRKAKPAEVAKPAEPARGPLVVVPLSASTYSLRPVVDAQGNATSSVRLDPVVAWIVPMTEGPVYLSQLHKHCRAVMFNGRITFDDGYMCDDIDSAIKHFRGK